MPAYRLPSPFDRPPPRRRASGLALAIGVNLLLFLALLGISKFAPMAEKASRTLSIDLLPAPDEAVSEQRREQRQVEQQRPARTIQPPPIHIPMKPTIAPPPVASDPPWIEMSKADMAAADVRNLPKAGSGGGDSEVVGNGPNGETLYAAEWARRPTGTELGGYLPANAPDGWGLIACRTIANNRVEDCIELGQSPAGSRLASAVRQAAWQFRIRPPRKNGRPMVGEWVRIRIDYIRVSR